MFSLSLGIKCSKITRFGLLPKNSIRYTPVSFNSVSSLQTLPESQFTNSPAMERVIDPFYEYRERISLIRKGLVSEPLFLDIRQFPEFRPSDLKKLVLRNGVRGEFVNHNRKTFLVIKSHNNKTKTSASSERSGRQNSTGKPEVNDAKNLIPLNINPELLKPLGGAFGKFDELMDEFGNEAIKAYQRISGDIPTERTRFRDYPLVKAPRHRAPNSMLRTRSQLPTFRYKKTIIETVNQSPVTIVTGTTGSGKSTQIPQYLLDGINNVSRIMVVQPRRISAIALAQRVSDERGTRLGETIGYQVRNDRQMSDSTQVLFVTTGILLRRLVHDPNLTGFSHIVMDEVHERSLNSDFCLTILKQILQRRSDLKLVAMSATFNSGLFSHYLSIDPRNPAPHIDIPGVSFPVQTVHLEEILHQTNHLISIHDLNPAAKPGARSFTQSHYVKEFQKMSNGEIIQLYDNTAMEFPGASPNLIHSIAHTTTQFSQEKQHHGKLVLLKWEIDMIMKLLDKIVQGQKNRTYQEGAVLVFLPGWEEINLARSWIESTPWFNDSCTVLPLHSSIPPSDQRRVFDPVAPGKLKVVLSTNVAETGITIADAVYVIDTGKVRESNYDPASRISSLAVQWISQANAIQRSGRAGRVKPGVSFRLYPKKSFDTMPKFPVPEIMRTPLESIILQALLLGLCRPSIQHFLNSFIDPPQPAAIKASLSSLKDIGAIEIESERLTLLGRLLASMPVAPADGKLLVYASLFNCLDAAITLVATRERDVFVLPSSDRRTEARKAQLELSEDSNSDIVAAINGYKRAALCEGSGMTKFCDLYFINPSAIKWISQTRNQLLQELDQSFFISPPTSRRHPQTFSFNHRLSLIRLKSLLVASLYPNFAHIVRKGKRNPKLVIDEQRHGVLPISSIVSLKPLDDFSSMEDWVFYTDMFVTRELDAKDLTPALTSPTLVDSLCFLIFTGGKMTLSEPPRRRRSPLNSTLVYLVLDTPTKVFTFEINRVSAQIILRIRDMLDKLLTLQLSQSTHLNSRGSSVLTGQRLIHLKELQSNILENIFLIIADYRRNHHRL